jgi:protein-disulfide isomerase
MLPSPARHRVAVVLALLGVAVSALTFHVTSQLVSVDGYTSFCNLGSAVNCDTVLSSKWGTFLGLPVSLWALGVFTLGALLALPGAMGATTVGLADLALLALVSGSLGFALVLAFVSWFVLRTACLLCLTMDIVIVAWFITVAPLARRFQLSARAPLLQRQSAAYAAAAVGLLLAVAGGTVEAVRRPPGAASAAEVQAADPKFYETYRKLPVLPAADVLGPGTHVKGPADAPFTIVEFSDFECPACGHAFGDLRSLVRSRSDVKLVFRHFPLDSHCNSEMHQQLHPDACLAAAAAECAGRQGRFWEYHDLLFEHQKALDRDSLFRYARDLDLDIPEFRSCLDDPATMARIAEDVSAGARLGIESTPTIFINGRRIQGALDRPYYDFALVIEKETQARATQASRSGS